MSAVSLSVQYFLALLLVLLSPKAPENWSSGFMTPSFCLPFSLPYSESCASWLIFAPATTTLRPTPTPAAPPIAMVASAVMMSRTSCAWTVTFFALMVLDFPIAAATLPRLTLTRAVTPTPAAPAPATVATTAISWYLSCALTVRSSAA